VFLSDAETALRASKLRAAAAEDGAAGSSCAISREPLGFASPSECSPPRPTRGGHKREFQIVCAVVHPSQDPSAQLPPGRLHQGHERLQGVHACAAVAAQIAPQVSAGGGQDFGGGIVGDLSEGFSAVEYEPAWARYVNTNFTAAPSAFFPPHARPGPSAAQHEAPQCTPSALYPFPFAPASNDAAASGIMRLHDAQDGQPYPDAYQPGQSYQPSSFAPGAYGGSSGAAGGAPGYAGQPGWVTYSTPGTYFPPYGQPGYQRWPNE
jgi:hypothetical protein